MDATGPIFRKSDCTNDFPLLNNPQTIPVQRFFRQGEGVYIHKSGEAPEYVGVFHRHAYIEIVYVLSGEAVHYVGDQRVKAMKGDLFIVEFNTPHAFVENPDCPQRFEAFELMFTPDFIDTSLLGYQTFQHLACSSLFYSLLPEERVFGPDLHLYDAGFQDFGELFGRIYREYREQRKGYCEIIRAYVTELLVKTLRAMDEREEKKQEKGTAVSLRQAQYLEMAVDYLRTHYNTPVRLEELAMKSFLSKSYFGKLFKDLVGMGFSEYLQKLRIDEVCKRLQESDTPVAEIANQCGFHDMKFFYLAFKKATGKTPGEYRKSL